MKYIKQFTIIMTICLLGELLAKLLPFTIPASVYGLFIMLIALMTKVVKVEYVKETSDFLMDVMPIMFVPASVGLMVSWELLKEILIPVLVVSVLGTLIVMIISGKTVDALMKLSGGESVMSDGITVNGEAINEAELLSRGSGVVKAVVEGQENEAELLSRGSGVVKAAVEGQENDAELLPRGSGVVKTVAEGQENDVELLPRGSGVVKTGDKWAQSGACVGEATEKSQQRVASVKHCGGQVESKKQEGIDHE